MKFKTTQDPFPAYYLWLFDIYIEYTDAGNKLLEKLCKENGFKNTDSAFNMGFYYYSEWERADVPEDRIRTGLE